MRKQLLLGLTLSVLFLREALCQVSDFVLPAEVCLNQATLLTNNSTGASSYLWDFCQDGLTHPVAANLVANLSSASPAIVTPEGIDVAFDNGTWFGFAFGRDNNNLYRLEFGQNLSSTPLVVSLGNVGGEFFLPTQIKIISQNGNWYGFGVNFSDSHLIRLDFGSTLANSPSATDLGSLGTGQGPRGLDIVFDGTNYVGIISFWTSGGITLFRLGLGIDQMPDQIYQITNAGDVPRPVGVALFKSGSNWYGLVANYSDGKLFHLTFGNDLFSNPVFSPDPLATIPEASALEIIKDGLNFYALIESNSGLVLVEFGQDLAYDGSETVRPAEGFGGVFNSLFGLACVRDGAEWRAFTLGQGNGIVHQVIFQDICATNPPSINKSLEVTPTSLTYENPGTYVIELLAYNGSGQYDYKAKTISVKNSAALPIDFTSTNQCIEQINSFSAIVSDPMLVTSYSWDFGNGNTGSGSVANFQFDQIGLKQVKLTVVSNQGCTSELTKSILIVNKPLPDFELPTQNTCTNDALTFANTTTADQGSNLQWKWLIDGIEVSNTEDLVFEFSSVQNFAIKLVASIPGCESEITKDLTSLSEGPLVDFTYTNNCFGEPVRFTNLTTGTGLGSRHWSFGDGAVEDAVSNPEHQFASAGNFTVGLLVTNDQGCTNEKEVIVRVNDQDLADFNYAPATENIPFTITGTDLSLLGDQIVQWNWDFGNGAVQTGNPVSANFSTPGEKSVELHVVTSQGCQFNLIKGVQVQPSSEALAAIDFTREPCRGERIDFVNTTVNGATYQWDFCFEDLANIKNVGEWANLPQADVPEGIATVFDKGVWYTFITSRNNNKLFRIPSMNQMLETGAISELEIAGLAAPMDVRFVKLGSVWYAFIINSANGRISRLRFGNGLNSNPDQVTDLGNLGMLEPDIRGFDLFNDGINWYGATVNFRNDKITVINLGASIVGPTIDPVSTLAFVSPTVQQPISIEMKKDSEGWHALVSSFKTNAIVHLNFKTDLIAQPSESDITAIYSLQAPFDVRVVREGLRFKGYGISATGAIHFLDFGPAITNSLLVGEDKTNFSGAISDGSAIDVVQTTPDWKLLTVDYFRKRVSLVSCEGTCVGISLQDSNEREPAGIFYDGPGEYPLEFTAFHSNGNAATVGGMIAVTDKVALPLSLQSESVSCRGVANTFTATDGFSNYVWNFGVGSEIVGSASVQEYTHENAGIYEVKLTATAENGCKNFVSRPIEIFNPPEPAFSIPGNPGQPTCSNQVYLFSNTTLFDPNSDPTWQWLVNGTLVSTDKDLTFAYPDAGTQVVRLSASLSGCEESVEFSVTDVMPGPIVDFQVNGACVDNSVEFTNRSQGAIIGYNWSINNGLTSDKESFQYKFSETGSYTVRLTANTTNGCDNFLEKEIGIYSAPQPSFTLDLPPFSCSGTPAQFHDITPAPDDSNIESWSWDFGDGLNPGVGKDPTHTYADGGDYLVSLSVTTDRGCSNTIQLPVSIQQSPNPSFTLNPACVNQPVHFQPIADPAIKSWKWQINNSSYSTANPTHIFLNSGTYDAQLEIVGTNNCVASLSKSVVVPLIPDLNFSAANTCEGSETILTNESISVNDEITSTQWTLSDSEPLSGNEVEFIFDQNGSYPVKMTVGTRAGCFYALSKTVTIYETPIANFTASEESGTPPLAVAFENSSTGATTYSWLLNGVAFSQDASVEKTFSALGDYVVDLVAISDTGCKDSKSMLINVIIPRTELALEQFNLIKEAATNLVRNQLVVKNNSNYKINEFDVLLDLGNGTTLRERISDVISPGGTSTFLLSNSLVGVSSGYVCVELVIPNDLETENNKKCNPLQEVTILFNPSPNPAHDNIRLEIIADEPTRALAWIFNSLGERVAEVPFDIETGLNVRSMDVSNLNPGLYFLVLEANGQKSVHRIVLQ